MLYSRNVIISVFVIIRNLICLDAFKVQIVMVSIEIPADYVFIICRFIKNHFMLLIVIILLVIL